MVPQLHESSQFLIGRLGKLQTRRALPRKMALAVLLYVGLLRTKFSPKKIHRRRSLQYWSLQHPGSGSALQERLNLHGQPPKGGMQELLLFTVVVISVRTKGEWAGVWAPTLYGSMALILWLPPHACFHVGVWKKYFCVSFSSLPVPHGCDHQSRN